jgi:16S rRNA (adenine1518-N6/adenine1519-N6)-dimethyltransferase
MVQRELAGRIAARPKSRDWSPLSIFIQLRFDVRLCFDVAPDCFRPRPKVTSSVIELTPTAPVVLEDAAAFERVVRRSFAHKRKLLLNNLVPEIIPDTGSAMRIWNELGLSANCRAEEMPIESFLRLTRALTARNMV